MPPNPPLDRLKSQLLKTNLQQTNQPLYQIIDQLINQLRQFINQIDEDVQNINITGTGDVVGPASATDNAIARFNGTSGKLIQNSGITIADGTSGTLSNTNTGDVSLAGTPDYITIAGQTITRNQIDLTTDVLGALPIGNGGTGQVSQTAAFNALSPTTTKGDIIVDNGTNDVRLPVGTNGQILSANSGTATGLEYINNTGGGDVIGPVSSINNEIVLFDGATGKLIKSAIGTGVVKSTSGVFSVGNVSLVTEIVNTLNANNGGTGIVIPTNNAIIFGSGGAVLNQITPANNSVLRSGATGIPTWTTTLPAVDGNAITNLNATNLGTGTVNDLRLSSNIPLKNGTNAFTGANSFNTNPVDLLIGQIQFPAIQNPSAGANILDDYEEGTWTPTIGGTGGESGQVYSIQQGYYVKIGSLIHVSCRVQLSTLGTITGSVQIKGLPFTTINSASYRATVPVIWGNLTLAVVNIVGTVNENATVFTLTQTAAATTSINNQFLVQADLTNTTIFTWSLVYRTNQ